MKPLKLFEEFLKGGTINRKTPDFARANSLLSEAQKRKEFLLDLQRLLEYEDWRNFLNVIEKAKIACEKSGQNIQDHFVEVNKKVKIGSSSFPFLLLI